MRRRFPGASERHVQGIRFDEGRPQRTISPFELVAIENDHHQPTLDACGTHSHTATGFGQPVGQPTSDGFAFAAIRRNVPGGPVGFDGSSVEIGSIEVEGSPVEGSPVAGGPIGFEGSSVEIGPIEVEGSPVEIGPIEVESSPVEIGPVQVEGSPVEIGPVQVDRAGSQPKSSTVRRLGRTERQEGPRPPLTLHMPLMVAYKYDALRP